MNEEATLEVESKNTKKQNPRKITQLKTNANGKDGLRSGETLMSKTWKKAKHLKMSKLSVYIVVKCQTRIMFEHGDVNKMMTWQFDQKESKKPLTRMVIVDELPFSFVEREDFKHYSKIYQPLFDVPCRSTTTQDCYKLHDDEKNKLLNVIQNNIGRVCLTINSLTSLQKKSYMDLTGYFVDSEWKLKKKVLNFCRLDGHSGVHIGKG
ncbi:zinc finger BED domain-containing protein RICESLEEPER 2-like protein [Tanacetum coccineum]